ncbi:MULTISPECIES: pentapeptide repeat-containing protein [unclassified Arthrobacter]|uniref:pentapeptide repeat-containing protein n=1 Tax=unclassified Arthrobacter TaxID=235627 RepID=UPI00288343A9|nr:MULTISPECIES: pentapeptide repeat-containing protein [unclassified Arthrobacter]
MTLQPTLRPDCGNCFALCCTALGFARSADFAIDKPAATPCPNMSADFSCAIHERLRPRGFRGCTVFDCFGAGQVVSQHTFGGTSWMDNPSSTSSMFAAFKVVRQLHEMLWYLAEAQQRTFDPHLASAAGHLSGRIASIAQGDATAILNTDVETLHEAARALLMDVSEELRASYGAEDTQTPDDGPHLDGEHSGADLMGANLANQRLCGFNFRSAYLIGASLRNSDLTAADLLGADLRGTHLHGADLSKALYLTQPQITAAEGDLTTLLPQRLTKPEHWRFG